MTNSSNGIRRLNIFLRGAWATMVIVDVAIAILVLRTAIKGSTASLVGPEAPFLGFLLGVPAIILTLLSRYSYRETRSEQSKNNESILFSKKTDWIAAFIGSVCVALLLLAGRSYQVYTNNHQPCFSNGATIPCTSSNKESFF